MRWFLFSLALLSVPALAQQPQPPATPMEQALGGKLGEEYNQNIQLRASMVQLQAQLSAAQARLKVLEDQQTKIDK